MSTQTFEAHEPGCACKCHVSGQRNRFFKGKMMKAPEFEMEQRYAIDRRRLLTRAIAGWGVVRGLGIEGARGAGEGRREAREFAVLGGLALDPHGREIVLHEETVIGADNTFVAGGKCEFKSVEKLEPGRYVLAIHYAERVFGESGIADDCCGTKIERNYVCETMLFSLRRIWERCPCGEPGCPHGCKCGSHGGCGGSCLCEWTAKIPAPECPGKPCRWRGHKVWIEDGVDLACLEIEVPASECRAPRGWIEDDCGPRRIVKSNAVLYDLVRGCSFTRIKSLSWGAWHRRKDAVPWKEFIEVLDGHEIEGGMHRTGLSVTFTGPVLTRTIQTDCFRLQFAEGHGWMRPVFVEIVAVTHAPPEGDDPAGTTRHVTLWVRHEWFEDFRCHGSSVRKDGAEVEIQVRGDFILDCHGQPVDADARGFALQEGFENPDACASGNRSPGGTLVSPFKVHKENSDEQTR